MLPRTLMKYYFVASSPLTLCSAVRLKLGGVSGLLEDRRQTDSMSGQRMACCRDGVGTRHWLTLGSGLLECLCFAGVMFGWASLVFILKDENYFGNLCKNGTAVNSSVSAGRCALHVLVAPRHRPTSSVTSSPLSQTAAARTTSCPSSSPSPPS